MSPNRSDTIASRTAQSSATTNNTSVNTNQTRNDGISPAGASNSSHQLPSHGPSVADGANHGYWVKGTGTQFGK